jgi:hypothetical protein
MDWMDLAENRGQQQTLLNMGMNVRFHKIQGVSLLEE